VDCCAVVVVELQLVNFPPRQIGARARAYQVRSSAVRMLPDANNTAWYQRLCILNKHDSLYPEPEINPA
jgi:hypothetical protein